MKFKRFAKMIAAGVTAAMLLTGCGDTNPAEAAKKKYSDDVILGTYKGVEYTPQHSEVTDDDIQYDIDRLLSQATEKKQVTDRAAADGDTVNIDFLGKVDGVAFDGGSTFDEAGVGSGYLLVLGSGSFIDGFEAQIVGHKPGETFDVNVTFPDNYQAEELAGKPAVFATTLNYIEEKVLPDYTDELVAANTEYKTMAEYEAAMRAQHEEENKNNDDYQNHEALVAKVIENASVVAYPEQEMKERMDTLINSMKESAQANNIEFSTYLAYYGFTTEDDFIKEIESALKSHIERTMVITAIAKAENIKVSEEEVTAKINELLSQTGYTDVAQLNQAYGYTNDDYYMAVMEEKVIRVILDNAVEVAETAATETTEAAEEVTE